MAKVHRFKAVLTFAFAITVALTGRSSGADLRAQGHGLTDPVHTSSVAGARVLRVNPAVEVRPFSDQMLGAGLVNWEHSWGKPFPDQVPGLTQAMREQGVKLIRYAGGLWANDVGFDRTTQSAPYDAWVHDEQKYYFRYGTDELASVHSLAKALGAEVIIQVNIATFDPAMWADMVRYTNVEQGYNFKYWELGNELDYATDKNIGPSLYVERAAQYVDAMKAVDGSIQIIGGVPAAAHDGPRLGYRDDVTSLSAYLTGAARMTSPAGRGFDDLSYHWYQACYASDPADLLRWSWEGLAQDSWRNAYSRKASEIIPQRVNNELIQSSPMRQGITEINFDACDYDNVLNGNHLNALWASDVIGRLAYNGLDFLTWYEGYGSQGYATIYPDNADHPTRLFLRPSYYAFFMYARYFGDVMVESHSYDPNAVSIWASTDTRDPGTIKLRLTNLTGEEIDAPIDLSGTMVTSGRAYVLASTAPLDMSPRGNLDPAPTTINGVTLDAMDVAGSAQSIEGRTVVVNGSSFNYALPPYSSVAIVLQTE